MKDAEGDQTGDSLLLGSDAHSVVIRAVGHIRANDCYPLREELFPELDAPGGRRECYVDLSRCTYMDSTFIGLLVAMDKKIGRQDARRRLHLMNPAPECLESLRKLGLDRKLSIENGTTLLPAVRFRGLNASEKPAPEFILKTHEALMETSEEARKKFGLVMDLLAKKIREK